MIFPINERYSLYKTCAGIKINDQWGFLKQAFNNA